MQETKQEMKLNLLVPLQDSDYARFFNFLGLLTYEAGCHN